MDDQTRRYKVRRDQFPEAYPTHLHEPAFWEALGRVVATFGFLEEVLGKAIFALTATREYSPDEEEAALANWLPTLMRALSDSLGSLIDRYSAELEQHQARTTANWPELIIDLKKASAIRNVLCHGSWRAPDSQGRSVPLFVNNKGELFTTPVDVAYLTQVQAEALELISSGIDTVTHMGFQFPGSRGHGKPIHS